MQTPLSETSKSEVTRIIREERIAVALRMIKKGGYTPEQIQEVSQLTAMEVQGLLDNTRTS